MGVQLNETERRVLNEFQHGLPLEPRPFARMAAQLDCDEAGVIALLRDLQARGLITRVGPVFHPRRIGASTLAAMAVPPERLEEVAALVSAIPGVNHNYEREHHINLWFVVTAADQEALAATLADIEAATGLEVLDLPMLDDYFIDLGFQLTWA